MNEMSRETHCFVEALLDTRAGCKGPGLAIARRPVRDVSGEITIESVRARGSRVDLFLRAALASQKR